MSQDSSYYKLYDQVYDCAYDSDSEDYFFAISSDITTKVDALKITIDFSKFLRKAIIDSKSVCRIIKLNLAKNTLGIAPTAECTKTPVD